MFVIMREDGAYVAPPGQESSYTRNLQCAWTFSTREGANAETCPANERVVAVSEIMDKNRTENRQCFS